MSRPRLLVAVAEVRLEVVEVRLLMSPRAARALTGGAATPERDDRRVGAVGFTGAVEDMRDEEEEVGRAESGCAFSSLYTLIYITTYNQTSFTYTPIHKSYPSEATHGIAARLLQTKLLIVAAATMASGAAAEQQAKQWWTIMKTLDKRLLTVIL